MHGCVLQRSKIGEQLVDVRLGDTIVQIGDQQLRSAAARRHTTAECGSGTQQLLAALEHVVLPCAVHIALMHEKGDREETFVEDRCRTRVCTVLCLRCGGGACVDGGRLRTRRLG